MANIPPWITEMNERLTRKSHSAFILHLNIHDPVMNYTVDRVLTDSMFKSATSGMRIRLPMHMDRTRALFFNDDDDELLFRIVIGYAKNQQHENIWTNSGISTTGNGPLPRSPELTWPIIQQYVKTYSKHQLFTMPEVKRLELFQGEPPSMFPSSQNRMPLPMALFVHNAPLIAPAGDSAHLSVGDRTNVQALLNLAKEDDMNNNVILFANNLLELHSYLISPTSRFHAVRIPYPNEDARKQWMMKISFEGKKIIGAKDATHWARISSGLRLNDLRDLFSRFLPELPSDEQFVLAQEQIMQTEFGGILEPIHPRFGWDFVGGLEHIKRALNLVIDAIKKGQDNRVPMGLLFLGPAGTGKSIVAEALAYEAKINAVALNLSRVYSKWVGESERNLEQAIEAIMSLTPCLVWIDEVDQSFQRGEEGDSGVSQRLFKRILEVMSNPGNRGKVIFVGASNRPDRIDAALKRAGRFDRKFLFEVPGQEQRASIIQVMIRRYAETAKVKAGDVASLAESTKGWTGAELESLTIKACDLAGRDGGDVTGKHFKDALQFIRCATKETDFMTALAILEVDDLEFLPDSYKADFDQKVKWAEKVVAQGRK